MLERDPIQGEQALYRRSEDHRAAFTVIFMKEDISFTISEAEVSALLTQHVFDAGPRGRMVVEAILAEKRSVSGNWLMRRTAIVEDAQGTRQLLTVDIARKEYGLGFIQSTLALPDELQASEITDAQLAFHDEVIDLTRSVFSVEVLR